MLKLKISRGILILSMTLLIITVTGLIVILSINNKATSVQSRLQQINVGFDIYYPSPLPSGMKVEPNALNVDQNIVNYLISDESGGTINVSQQALPKTQLGTELPKTREVQVDAGKAAISRFDSKSAAIIIKNDSSMIIINSKAAISDSKLNELLASLKAVK